MWEIPIRTKSMLTWCRCVGGGGVARGRGPPARGAGGSQRARARGQPPGRGAGPPSRLQCHPSGIWTLMAFIWEFLAINLFTSGDQWGALLTGELSPPVGSTSDWVYLSPGGMHRMHVHPPPHPCSSPPPQPERLVMRKDEAVGNKKKMQVCLPATW